jgi:hypothetical protein
MPTMFSRSSPLFALLMILLVSPYSVAMAQTPDDDPLLGTWVTNVAKSQLSGTPFKSQVRTFDLSEGGLILCTLSTVTAKGGTTYYHWFTRLDGNQMPEFSRAQQRTHTNSITLKKVAERSYEIIGKTLATGKQHLSGTAEISADGKTMIWRTVNLDLQNNANKQLRFLEKQQ